MYKIVLINHFKRMQQAVQSQQAKCSLDMDNFHLTVEKGDLRLNLQPQFFTRNAQGLNFTPIFNPEVINFVGWLPYFNKRWELGYDKLAFKKFAAANRHRTPAWWENVDAPIQNVLRKKSRSSIGRGISGPYRLIEPGAPDAVLGDGEYFETFSFGRICKVWYWNEQPVAAEIRQIPTVEGDGVRTVRQIVAARVDPFNREINWPAVEATLRYLGLSIAHVPKAGEKVVVDYQYASRLTNLTFENDNIMLTAFAPELLEEMRRMGENLWAQIPQDIRQNTLFSVDGMVDDQNQIWWLEANCNPLVHPDVYPLMIRGIMATAVQGEPQPVPQGA